MAADAMETKGQFIDKLLANRSARSIPCSSNEYRYKGVCCQYCPAGTHVSTHCSQNHGHGTCNPCTPGTKFTAYPNGMDACLSCRVCRPEDEVRVAECTPTSNTMCRCKEGTYCIPDDNCDLYCTPCQSCPEGQYMKHSCTVTADTVCENPGEVNPAVDSTTVLIIVVPIVFIALLVIIILGFVLWKKRQKDKEKQCGAGDTEEHLLDNGAEASNAGVPPPDTGISCSPFSGQPGLEEGRNLCDEDSIPLSQVDEGHRVTERTDLHRCVENLPEHGDEEDHQLSAAGGTEESYAGGTAEQAHTSESCSCVRSDARCTAPLTDQEWLQCYNSLKNSVPPSRWKELMRNVGLTDIDIEHIALDHNDTHEKHYQMFLLWRNQSGRQVSMVSVFRALDKMKLGGCRENIANEIKSKGIRV
ncbi:tumor necrosis factor receptor superfamily member 1A-like [Pseudophryne corroboree]|uniref:tumor necrosis factor receptor superfamily member 1A-like n=1 Tax=Pseudophryne corroboree TaxID=495146 RepID=UPI00308210DF